MFACTQTFEATIELLVTDLVIRNHGQGTRTTPELATSLLTTQPYQLDNATEDRWRRAAEIQHAAVWKFEE
ncbi:hypothetical protein TNCV_1577821 [Trichonephila clavipes]|nr:hypothetical protein TNCV_1577821 [Trichonephila clavipes]